VICIPPPHHEPHHSERTGAVHHALSRPALRRRSGSAYGLEMRLVIALVLVACDCGDPPGPGPGVRDAGGDASRFDAAPPGMDSGTRDAGFDAHDPYAMDSGGGCEGSTLVCKPVERGCSATEVCGDGLDNDCDGTVDDSCGCEPGTVQSCFLGPPGSRNVGACRDGTQRCDSSGEFGSWGPCTGISPSPETCDGLDNDCNGCADEHECCTLPLTCPGPGDPRVPATARPFEDITIDGTTIYSGVVRSWLWTVRGGPCDDILPVPTFTAGSTTSSSFTFNASLSGDYTVTMTIVTPSGETLSCVFVVHVAGEGLRVELCWDEPSLGSSDLDLYLHEPGTTTPWYAGAGSVVTPGVTLGNSCNWANCAPGLRSTLPRANWGLPASPIDRCDRGPAGPGWVGIGSCPNPRIDIDGHGSEFEPLHGYTENINVDNPQDGQTFRIMIHDCTGPPTTPLLNVYCGGFLRGTLGAPPDIARLPGGLRCATSDSVWRAADVTVHVDAAGVTTGCDVVPIRDAAGGFPFLTTDDPTF
jgi:hypothetical protein